MSTRAKNNMSRKDRPKYSLEVMKDEESGELYFEFPDALRNQMGWRDPIILALFTSL